MAFTVEDGTGLSAANALISTAYADTYHADRGNTAWAALPDATTKQQNIVKATDYIDDLFGNDFVGYLLNETQGCCFPRMVNSLDIPNQAYNKVSIGLVNTGIPEGIKQAIAELALIASTQPLLKTVGRGKKKVKIGSMEVEYDGQSDTQQTFVVAIKKVEPWLAFGNVGGIVQAEVGRM